MRPDGSHQPDHYTTLGVTPTATRAQIAKAYRRLAFTWHPDRNPDRAVEASARFVVIQAAYDVLSDARQRADYDIAHMPPRAVEPERHPPAAAPAPADAGPRRHNPRRASAGESPRFGDVPASTLPTRAVSGLASAIMATLVGTAGFGFITILGPRFALTNPELFARWRRGKTWWLVTARILCVLALVVSAVAFAGLPAEPAPPSNAAELPRGPSSNALGAAVHRGAETIADGVFSSDPETRHAQAAMCLVVFLALLLMENIVFAVIWLADTLETARGKTR